jgi:hypothetical protein
VLVDKNKGLKDTSQCHSVDHRKIKNPTPKLRYIPDTAAHIEKKADTPRADLVKKKNMLLIGNDLTPI